AEAIAQADLDRDALCGAEFVIGHGATPYRNGRVLHSVFAAAELARIGHPNPSMHTMCANEYLNNSTSWHKNRTKIPIV
ncbi:hypothetical protein, partial [Pseudomonas aeruginosa]|uniref:hypothetical protein n=1 Tax=Pseudomonas aeruginosa TaxID=287 RepID=UPI001AEBF9C7